MSHTTHDRPLHTYLLPHGRRLLWLVLLLSLGGALSACGQKGELYLPTDTTDQSQQQQ